jgi:hypothetical protein
MTTSMILAVRVSAAPCVHYCVYSCYIAQYHCDQELLPLLSLPLLLLLLLSCCCFCRAACSSACSSASTPSPRVIAAILAGLLPSRPKPLMIELKLSDCTYVHERDCVQQSKAYKCNQITVSGADVCQLSICGVIDVDYTDTASYT